MDAERRRRANTIVAACLAAFGVGFVLLGVLTLLGFRTRPTAAFYTLPALVNFAGAWHVWSRRAR